MRKIEVNGASLPDRPLDPRDPIHPGDPPGSPPPALQTWSRLEPLPQTADIRAALQARVADPLWLLARQWQFLEFAGEDAGTPIEVRVEGEAATLSRLQAGNLPPRDYDPDAMPLEVAVEAEPIRARHPRVVADAALHLRRMLDAAGVGEHGLVLATAYPLALGTPRAGDADADWAELARGRAIDARALYAALAPLRATDGSLTALPAHLGIPLAAEGVVRQVLAHWLHWYEDDVVEPPGDAADAWSRHHLEYAFATSAQTSNGEVVVAAEQYPGGTLDWHSVSLSPVSLGAPANPSPPRPARLNPTIPVPADYTGKPADRFWAFEDAAVHFGAVEAGPTDLTRLLLIEFALVYGNDWFVVPARLPVGSMFRMTRFTVLDTFGVASEVGRAQDGDQRWSLFELGGSGDPEHGFFIAPTLSDALGSPPIEQVALFRDEMANMVWGVERRVQGVTGDGYDRAGEPPAPAVPRLDHGASLDYRLATAVPDHWIAFVPVASEGSTIASPVIELQRRAMRRVDADGQQRTVEPLGVLLGGGTELRLAEEEVLREGAVVERAFQHTRWFDGRSLLWLGRRKVPGRGEGASGLRFDVLEQAGTNQTT